MSTQTNSLQDLKKRIRIELLKRRKMLDCAWVARASDIIQQKVLTLEEFSSADTVFCYISVDNEVDTKLIIEQTWKMQKNLCVPLFVPEFNEYKAVKFTADMSLIPGHRGIPEPSANAYDFIPIEKVDIAIVPGIAFDQFGGRLGRGAGVYDTFLSSSRHSPFKVGLAFEMQVIDKVPMEDNDVLMDAVITEERLIRVSVHK